MSKTPSTKPGTIKWAKGLSIFQIVVGVLACAFFLWLFNTTATSPFVLGMQEGVAEGLGEASLYLSSAEGSGFLVGTFIFALIGPILTLVAIAKRRKGWSLAAVIFNGLTVLASMSLVTLVIEILLLVKPSRDYLGLSK